MTDWTAFLCLARAESLLGSLAFRLADQPLPPKVAAILADAQADAGYARTQALWEAEMACRALAGVAPAVLLKGTAYAAAGLDASAGRSIGDLDILVSRTALPQVERALLAAGWEWVKENAYDDHYYRTWMHELPPLIHRERDRMIDVHHTILPLTARRTPDAAALLADSIALPGGLRVLAPEDMVLHAVAHLFADGDLAGGLRNLWDIDRLLRQFAGQDGFWERLGARGRLHQLLPHARRALRLAARLYATPVDRRLAGRGDPADLLYERRLLARDGWGRAGRSLERFGFYLRSHLLRMPPRMLAAHLWKKARR
nr:nucleotidyltransferase family protein [Sphingomonas parva]